MNEVQENKTHVICRRAVWILGGLFIVTIYPGIFVANIMSLAAVGDGFGNINILFLVFLWGSLVYPLVYIVSLVWYLKTKDAERKRTVLKIFTGYFLSIIVIIAGIFIFAW